MFPDAQGSCICFQQLRQDTACTDGSQAKLPVWRGEVHMKEVKSLAEDIWLLIELVGSFFFLFEGYGLWQFDLTQG